MDLQIYWNKKTKEKITHYTGIVYFIFELNKYMVQKMFDIFHWYLIESLLTVEVFRYCNSVRLNFDIATIFDTSNY